ncbi:MAG: glutamine-hydrolyzing GMP synthase [Lentisphaerae bacterium]|nr:glutamine-hydrolyzing GMP synthase [Lentisphaerota bacterium]
MKKETILILDFGSQYTQLIARRIREENVFSKIVSYKTSFEELIKEKPIGIILSGGPSSILRKEAPKCDSKIFDSGVPILGICYGLQLMVYSLGGEVVTSCSREYGKMNVEILNNENIFKGITNNCTNVWMSHGDKVQKLPKGFISTAKTQNTPFAAIAYPDKNLYGIQFHPEVVHTTAGKSIIKNFCHNICKASGSWTMKSYIDVAIGEIRELVKKDKVILALSGGVDSSVAAALIDKAIGKQLTCIFVDNGLLRKNEASRVEGLYTRNFSFNLKVIDAEERFLKRLKGIKDPEVKRKNIGYEFIEVFNNEATKIENAKFLAQGTTYPDVIESISIDGNPSDTIKSHHNVGGLPEDMKLKLIEPLRSLFKDEVRLLGKELGLSNEVVMRQPFPGPGLGVRVLGEITKDNLDILREADHIVVEEMKKADLYYKTWQAFAVFIPVKTVGVMGDERTYDNVIAIRIVESVDGMTANWVQLPHDLLGKISSRIINEVRGINRVVYDITSKPPGTIEWE